MKVTRTSTSTMMVMPQRDTAPKCREMHDRITLPQLEIANTPTSDAADGVYRDMVRHTRTFDITAVGGGVVQPFAVALALGQHAEILSTKYVHDESWYVPQYQSDDEVYLWFPNGLDAGERITITPK